MQLIVCEECKLEHDVMEGEYKSDIFYCQECLNGLEECAECGDIYDGDATVCIQGSFFCEDCVDDLFYI